VKKLIAVVLVLMLSGPVSADGSCGALHGHWQDFKKIRSGELVGMQVLPSSRFYEGYVTGWVENSGLVITLPTDVTFDQLYAVVGKWLENHPEKWHLHRVECIYDALYDAFEK
jgi:hypothetical protein